MQRYIRRALMDQTASSLSPNDYKVTNQVYWEVAWVGHEDRISLPSSAASDIRTGVRPRWESICLGSRSSVIFCPPPVGKVCAVTPTGQRGFLLQTGSHHGAASGVRTSKVCFPEFSLEWKARLPLWGPCPGGDSKYGAKSGLNGPGSHANLNLSGLITR